MLKKISSIPFRFRFIIEIAVIAAIIGGYYYMFLMPLQEKTASLEKEYDDLVAKINDVRPYALSYDDFKKQLAMMEEQFAIVLKVLPDERGYYLLYDEVVGLAEKDGVKVTLFQPGGEKKVDNFHSSVNFKVKMEAPYRNLVRYLYDINYLDKIVNLQDLDIGVLKSDTGEKLLDISASLNSYRFNSTQSPADTGTKKKGKAVKAVKKGAK
jgi:type IV pilus assembly protein PilO